MVRPSRAADEHPTIAQVPHRMHVGPKRKRWKSQAPSGAGGSQAPRRADGVYESKSDSVPPPPLELGPWEEGCTREWKEVSSST